jgi:hypothetical protein
VIKGRRGWEIERGVREGEDGVEERGRDGEREREDGKDMERKRE